MRERRDEDQEDKALLMLKSLLMNAASDQEIHFLNK